MSAGFTPGPWSVVDPAYAGMDGIVSRDIVDSDDVGVAIVPIGAFREREQKREANARLIAAAPELYEALTALVFLVDNQPLPEPQRGEAYENAVHDAFEALAKARGEQVQA